MQVYLYLWRYQSFVASAYLNRVCESLQVFLVIGSSFFSVVLPLCPRWYCMHSLCRVRVEHVLKFVCFIVCISSLYQVLNAHPVCPMSLSGYLLHFSLNIPLWLYMSPIRSLGFSCFFIVLMVLKAIPTWHT